jgi:hypothetical protein
MKTFEKLSNEEMRYVLGGEGAYTVVGTFVDPTINRLDSVDSETEGLDSETE